MPLDILLPAQGKASVFLTSADGFSFIEEIKDVTCLLVVNSEDGPKRFHFPLPFVGLCLRWEVTQTPVSADNVISLITLQ